LEEVQNFADKMKRAGDDDFDDFDITGEDLIKRTY